MQRADRTIASTLALTLALSGPLSAQQMADGLTDLPEATQARLDELAAACEETGTLPEDVEDALSDLDCATVQEMAATGASGEAEAEVEGAAEVEAEADAETDVSEEAGEAAEEAADAVEGAAEGAANAADQALDNAEGLAEDAVEGVGDAAAATAEAAETAAEEAEAEVEAEAEAEATAESETETTSEATETDAQSDATAQADATADADAEVEAEAEAGAEAATDADTGTGDSVAEDDLRRALEEGADETLDQGRADTETATDGEAAAEAEAGTDTQADAEADAATEAEATESVEGPEDIVPMDAQAQADALAEDEEGTTAAAAATDDASAEAEPEMTEEVVTEEDVRQSSEDFGAAFGAASASARDDDDDDDDNNNTLRNAALLGLGAVALSEILRGNERVVSNSGDRVVIEDQGQLRVLRNDDVLLRRPGAEVQSYQYNDGSTRQVITYDDGTTVETVRTVEGRVLRRTRTLPDGTEIVLFDDTQQSQNVDVTTLPQADDGPRFNFQQVTEDELVAALGANAPQGVNRTFSLNQIRNIDAVRELAPEIAVDTINFETGSAAIRPTEAQELAALGNAMRRIIERDPDEVFLIEGHTDAVGSAAYNLALSDRRAESLALALTEYFDVPPSNMVLQGYGESDLLVETSGAEVRNRRAAVRRITPLLRQ
ncbi:OmpA family protein [Citreimonas sp.]|uniref:OmpA family protein n=1 Tax=Citreimonas sp. TaxID=3036715 RepID=UPI0035C7A5D8